MGLWRAVKKAAKKAAAAAQQVGEAVVESVQQVGEGIQEGIDGVANELGGGSSGNAWDFRGAAGAIADGADKALLGSAETVFYGVLDASETAHEGMTDAIGEVLGTQWADRYDAVTGRILEGSRRGLTGSLEALFGAVRNGTETAGTLLSGAGHVITGEEGGWGEVARGLGKGFQTIFDSMLVGASGWAGGAQTLVNAEARGRKLTVGEAKYVREVFADSVHYSRVRVKDSYSGLADSNDRPFTHLYTIYMKDTDPNEYAHVLVHEMTHVWQFENGGTDYMGEAVYGQICGKGYDWWRSFPDEAWEDLEPEQQAQLIEDAYRFGYFSGPSRGHFGPDLDYDGSVEDLDGDGVPDDYSVALTIAVRKLRKGIGAP